MIAQRQKRHQTIFERRKRTPFASVLKNLQVVKSVPDPNAQADRMWERLTEFVLFVRSGGKHRKPSEILKTFIKTSKEKLPKLTKQERQTLTRTFEFLRNSYKSAPLKDSPLATDQTHFYIMATALLDSNLLDKVPAEDLAKRLVRLAGFIGGKEPLPKTGSLRISIKQYLALSSEKTTDASRRSDRQKKFIQTVQLLGKEANDGPTNGVSKIRRSGEETSSGSTPGIAGEGEGVPAPKEKNEKAG